MFNGKKPLQIKKKKEKRKFLTMKLRYEQSMQSIKRTDAFQICHLD